MSSIADLQEELAADRIRISKLIDDAAALQERYRILTEDPTAVTTESLQSFLAEIDSYRTQGNEILRSFRTLRDQIKALPGGPVGATEREALQAAVTQLNDSTVAWINNTFVPFRDAARSEAARVAREEAEAAAAPAAPADVVEYRAVLNDGTGPGDEGTWYVEGANGEIDSSGLTQQAAQLRAEELNLGPDPAEDQVENEGPGAQPPEDQYRAVFNDGTGPGPEGTWYVLGPGGQTSFSGKGQAEAEAEAARLNQAAIDDENQSAVDAIEAENAAVAAEAARKEAALEALRLQATRAQQRKQANEGDWRLKLRLAEQADYLYRDPNIDANGILWPLTVTNGVIFPYTPSISTSYNASYTDQSLTHSNYKGYFYQNSSVGEISIDAVFTAQDTTEANYLLAVIHFFRSVTKMFYGQDAQRGSPPPLVFLQGLGEMQFNLHPCVVSTFQYTLPPDVDYIRARTTNITGNTADLLFRRDRQALPTNNFSAANKRLEDANLPKGAQGNRAPLTPGPGTLGVGTALNGPTYVPTKMNIMLTLLPIQTRAQQSQEFSLQQFANGSLQKGGFW